MRTDPRGTRANGLGNRGTGRAGPAPARAQGPKPFFLHLILGGGLSIAPAVLEATIDRIRTELMRIAPAGERAGAFFIVVHRGGDGDDELLTFGPRDIPVYFLPPESARDAQRLITRHLVGGARVGRDEIAAVAQTISGGTADDEPGRNLNFDVGGTRRGVSFVRVSRISATTDPRLLGRYFGETALHEFGHHFLDPGGHRFGGLMDPSIMIAGPERRFPERALAELRKRIAALP